jgi:hypothetical protein
MLGAVHIRALMPIAPRPSNLVLASIILFISGEGCLLHRSRDAPHRDHGSQRLVEVGAAPRLHVQIPSRSLDRADSGFADDHSCGGVSLSAALWSRSRVRLRGGLRTGDLRPAPRAHGLSRPSNTGCIRGEMRSPPSAASSRSLIPPSPGGEPAKIAGWDRDE